MDSQERLQVKVFSPYEIFYEGRAVSLSALNKTGAFDVLYSHTNFFTLLMPGRVIIDTGFNSIQIEIDSGVMRVHENNVTLFANV
jgi:F0F1-type ATP synthase epsilon subunit